MFQELLWVLEKSRSKQGCFGKCSHVFISQGGRWCGGDHQQDATHETL